MTFGAPVRRASLTFCFALAVGGSSGTGPLYDGFAAYSRGDYAVALRALLPLTEQGNPAAQFIIGYMHASGLGVPRDDAAAANWFREAAERRHAEAQFNLGVMYGHGRGVPRDDVEAAAWYRRAAEQGLAAAQSSLGTAYRTGRGVARNYAEAADWHLKAAEQGVAVAQHTLAMVYFEGKGRPRDISAGLKWCRQAAEQTSWRREGNRDPTFSRRITLHFSCIRATSEDHSRRRQSCANSAT